MSIHHNLIQSLTGDNGEIVLQFFVTFSRFEYALRRAGFVRRGDHNSVLPDWWRFAEERLGAQFADVADTEFAEASSYLLCEPPSKLIFDKSEKIVLCPPERRDNESDAQYLLRLV